MAGGPLRLGLVWGRSTYARWGAADRGEHCSSKKARTNRVLTLKTFSAA